VGFGKIKWYIKVLKTDHNPELIYVPIHTDVLFQFSLTLILSKMTIRNLKISKYQNRNPKQQQQIP
jgi:hypothetical protein